MWITGNNDLDQVVMICVMGLLDVSWLILEVGHAGALPLQAAPWINQPNISMPTAATQLPATFTRLNMRPGS
jgi:hypothetical protein